MSSSHGSPLASALPSRTASRMSPNTNRSPSAVPASPAMSSGSPVISPLGEACRRCARRSAVRRLRRRPAASAGVDGDAALGGEIDEAVGEIGVVGRERRLDLALGDRRR